MTDNALFMFLAGSAAAAIVSIFVVNRKQKNIRALLDRVNAYQNEKVTAARKFEEERTTSANALLEAEQQTRRATVAAEEVQSLLDEQSKHFPWLANAFSDLQQLRLQREENQLRYKKHPAVTAANKVAELARSVRATERRFRLTKYRIQFYEKLFPWLTEISGEDIESLINEKLSDSKVDEPGESEVDEPARKWLSEQEWSSLTNTQKYQKALDRWIESRKSSWEIGRDFERFVGYNLERGGYNVAYHGAIEGLEDLGRDLIAKKAGRVLIVQCKYWSRDRLIHEKHVFQTFATAVEYYLDNHAPDPGQGNLFGRGLDLSKVTPVLVVSCALSERAKQAAKVLGVKVQEFISLQRYPMIKCNIAQGAGEKIYHLPFDQQYDTAKILSALGECYAATVAEAEQLGFRRAWRWRPVAT
jgi:Restriction endonuclease